MSKTRSIFKKAVAVSAVSVMLVPFIPATAIAESDSQTIASDWFLLYKADEPTPTNDENYS